MLVQSIHNLKQRYGFHSFPIPNETKIVQKEGAFLFFKSSPNSHHNHRLLALKELFVCFLNFDDICNDLNDFFFSKPTCSKSYRCNVPDNLRLFRISSTGPRKSSNPGTDSISFHAFISAEDFFTLKRPTYSQWEFPTNTKDNFYE